VNMLAMHVGEEQGVCHWACIIGCGVLVSRLMARRWPMAVGGWTLEAAEHIQLGGSV